MYTYSYSALDTFEKCPYQFKLKYIDKFRPEESTLPLDLGSNLHKCKELCSKYIMNEKSVDKEYIQYVFENGLEEHKIVNINGQEIIDKIVEDVIGIQDIKHKYFEDYITVGHKSGLTYAEKLNNFWNDFDKQDNEWKQICAELEFKFNYNDRCYLIGKIDRVDKNIKTGALRVQDYKSSDSSYDDQHLKTPLQMLIYALACKYIYGVYPSEYQYDFICLSEKQKAGSIGFLKRGENKLNKLLDKIEDCRDSSVWKPKPSPLCYWCYASGNPECYSKSEYSGVCQYYSLWTRENKTWQVNQKWDENSNNMNKEVKTQKKQFKW